jgi:hypothetical protein
MFPIPAAEQKHRYLLIAIAAPAFLAILASLYPFEPSLLILTCILLGYIIIVGLIFVRSLRQLFAGITTIAILLSVATSNWPLRAAYTLSRPSFDNAAAQVRAGDPPSTPCWIGLFRIQKAEVGNKGILCLWTNNGTGFVQTGPNDLPFNLWSHATLDNSWQFISED